MTVADSSNSRCCYIHSLLLTTAPALLIRVAIAKKEHRSATTNWKRTRQARLGALHIPGFISQGLPPHNMFDVLDLVWDLLKAKNVYRTGPIR